MVTLFGLAWQTPPSICHVLTLPVVSDVSVDEAGIGSFSDPYTQVADMRAGPDRCEDGVGSGDGVIAGRRETGT